jgi:exodeoxyribonuclease VII large subunit
VADPAVQQRSGANIAEYSVSELAHAIKRALEGGFGYVRLKGEISGFRGVHNSGHAYFALKDDRAKIEAVIWRTTMQRLKIRPEEGMEVVATGRITTYPGSSKYQIVIDALEPAGLGALMAVLEERKRRLTAEGLFAEDRKRRLPFLPRVVGVITSPTGAVIRDMLHGFDERFPVRVIIWPVRVQGETSAAEVTAAIHGFNGLPIDGPVPRPDVLIVARGGGSLEDLWGFNDEALVRAAGESAIPLISAVGHETDWTLLDLVADARAPTPTKAAEWAVPKQLDLLNSTRDLSGRLTRGVRRMLEAARSHLRAARRGLPRVENLVALPRQRLDGTAVHLARCFAAQIERRRRRLAEVGRLPHPRRLVTSQRERFGQISGRLERALRSNSHAHAVRFARLRPRLQPRLLAVRVTKGRDQLESTSGRSRDALWRLAAAKRRQFERQGARLRADDIGRRLTRASERLTEAGRRLLRAFPDTLAARRSRLDGLAKLLQSFSYQSVLERGFALVRDAKGRAVRSVSGIEAKALIDIELADGCLGAEVRNVRTTRPTLPQPRKADTPSEGRSPSSSRGTKSRNNGGQGSLF